MAERASLTEERIRGMAPPMSGEHVLWDSKISGFGVRCFPSGRKVYILMYRVAGGGRLSPKRRMTLGEVGKFPLSAARTAAQTYMGEVAKGADPQADRKAVARRSASRLDKALDSYAAFLKQRHVVNREQIMRTLRRGMPGPADMIDLPSIDRQTIAAQITKIEAKGKVRTTQRTKAAPANVTRTTGGPGAAADFRAKANTFFNWAVNRGLIYANPLAGWRRERTTRAQMTSRKGRALSSTEIATVWNACAEVEKPYGDFIRLLMLCGQRRTETSRMRWKDIDPGEVAWTIPAAEAKNGRKHIVPLPADALRIIQAQDKFAGNPFVFAGRTKNSAISNWSKRQADLVAASGVAFTLHDLRRTFRSGLTRLGVDTDVAELMMNHTPDDLIETYDREPRYQERRQASDQWASYVSGLVSPSAGAAENVVHLDARVIA